MQRHDVGFLFLPLLPFQQPRGRISDHAHESCEDLVVGGIELVAFFWGDVVALDCEIEPGLRFGGFRLAVAEFAEEGGFVAPFPPSFSEVSADGAGGAADLVGEGVAFFCGEISGQVEDGHGSIECQLVHPQFFVVDNGSFGRGFFVHGGNL